MAYELTYNLINNDTEYTVSGVTGTPDNVVIPSIHDGRPVTAIGEQAFYDCKSLKNITIGENVKGIGEGAFMWCGSLENVTIGSNVTNIGIRAFNYCTSLISLTIPGNVTSIDKSAFGSCRALKSITIHEGIEKIGTAAFYGCVSLTSIKIPNGVTDIGSYTFSDCTSLTSVEIPDSVENIGQHAFENCPIEKATIPTLAISYVPRGSLKEVIITSGENIGDHAFYACTSLTSIAISNSVRNIGTAAFYDCISLTSIKIPDSVENIGQHAFENCNSLTNVTLGDSIEEISYAVFNNCINLKTVKLSKSLTTIGGWAFWGCQITEIDFPKTVTEIGMAAFAYNSLSELVIPSGVQTISESAFREQRNSKDENLPTLKTVVIPDSVEEIGRKAFYGNKSLIDIIIPSKVSIIGELAFGDCDTLVNINLLSKDPATINGDVDTKKDSFYTETKIENRKFYVYSDRLEEYKTTPNWDIYADEIVADDLRLSFIASAAAQKNYFVSKKELENSLKDVKPNIDLSDYAKTKYVDDKFNDVIEVAEGKTKSFTISSLANLGTLLGIDTSVVANEYSITNTTITYKEKSIELKQGDLFLIVDIEVPDYWVSVDDMKIYKMETQKVDLTEYVKNDALENYVKSTDKTSEAYVYVRLNGQDSVLARKAYDGSGSSLTGVIPMYVDNNKLRGGEPVNAYDYVNLNYFNNNNTLLFKLTLYGGTFTIRKQSEVEESLYFGADAKTELITTIEPIIEEQNGVISIDYLSALKSGLLQQFSIENKGELIINGTCSEREFLFNTYYIGKEKFSGPPIFSIKWSGGVYSIEKL